MATKSFTTDFRLNKKSSVKVIEAAYTSKKVEHRINQRVDTIRDKEKIDKIMSNLFIAK